MVMFMVSEYVLDIVAIDTMLKFEGDFLGRGHSDFTRKQTLSLRLRIGRIQAALNFSLKVYDGW